MGIVVSFILAAFFVVPMSAVLRRLEYNAWVSMLMMVSMWVGITGSVAWHG